MSLNLACGMALTPAALITFLCFYAFTAWTFIISLTSSHLLPVYHFVGLTQYRRLFETTRWWASMSNLVVYAACLVSGALLLGYGLAILIHRATRWQTLYRALLMLPLSVSFVVTGLLWQWLLNPSLGLQHAVRSLGWTDFHFDWLVRADRSIYTLVIAGIWQQTGMCMALFFAALSGVDHNLWKIASLEGISTHRFYLHVITPMLRPAFMTASVLMLSVAVKSYDLVVTLTGGGPDFSSDLPARFVVELINRQELGMGAAGACMLLGTVAAIVGPYLYLQLRQPSDA